MSQVSKVKGLNCPNCGGPLNVRGFAHTLSIVCPQCLSILDAKDPNFRILEKFDSKKRRVTLKIPLGSRGKWKGAEYEIIGFQQRTITVDGVNYSWGEYLLFNPLKGFRYLTEYNGHWNDVRTLRQLPERLSWSGKPRIRVNGVTYTHFQKANARTTFVLGEFPWQVERDDTAAVMDYISPPLMVSGEFTSDEQTWSVGEYTEAKAIWQAFQLKNQPPAKVGVYSNQPSPYSSKAIWRMFWAFAALALIGIIFAMVSFQDREVFTQRYSYTQGQPGEASFVTPVFQFQGRPSNVEIDLRTNVANNWAYFSMALINDETGEALDFGREVSYYFGTDSDGSWSEGAAGDTAFLSSVPAGRYYLRVEPQMAPGSKGMSYQITVRRDVPRAVYFWVAIILLVIPPIVATIRRFSFEAARWQESDYAS